MFRAIILAGGSGERFWPLSTPEKPKQFLRVFGGESLIRQSVSRLKGLVEPKDVFVITSKALVAGYSGLMPIVTIEFVRFAFAIAADTVLRNFTGFTTIWSDEKKPRTPLPVPPTPSAIAAPVSRHIGSPMMFCFGISGSSLRVAATSAFEVMTKTSFGFTSPLSRLTL